MLANIIFQFFNEGGPVMWPILASAIVAVAVVGERTFWWWRESRKRDPQKLEQILAALENSDTAAAAAKIQKAKIEMNSCSQQKTVGFCTLILLFAVMLVAAGCANDERRIEVLQKQHIAEATDGAITNGFAPSFIEALPGQRAVALKIAQPTGDDSSADWINKSEIYYSKLTNMIQGINSHYYCHNILPPDLCAGLEQHAVVLASVQYPLAATGGCSGYSALLVQNKIKLAEDMICQMVQAIYESAYWVPGASKRATTLYHVWLKKWNESPQEYADCPRGSVKDITP